MHGRYIIQKKKESSNKTSTPNKKQENSTQTSTDNKKEEEKIYTTNLSNLAISSKDAACEVSGKIVKISHAGSYTLSGSSSDAQILVDAPKTESVTLICNGISIKNSNSSALYIKSADKVTLELSGNTKNTITDGTSYSLSSGATEPNSAIFSQEDLIIKGNGSLYVTANYQDGIATKNDLKIHSHWHPLVPGFIFREQKPLVMTLLQSDVYGNGRCCTMYDYRM